jgi:2,4-dienoyl-CoA reductase-like NADH-dependent reductase (Old Yellow Enzyme family)
MAASPSGEQLGSDKMSNEAAANQAVSIEPLFEPLTVGDTNLPNRVVMSPMSRNFSPSGLLNPESPAYYRRRAEGGCGLIVSEGAAVPHPVAPLTRWVPHFCGESLPVWAKVAREVQAAGSKFFVQLWHPGLGRKVSVTDNPLEPSIGPGTEIKDGEKPTRAMTLRDIEDVITAFGAAAADAKALGLDGVNIHGAHGYLLDQFLWDQTNTRTDEYGGGDIGVRTRFTAEVVKEVRRQVGPGFPIMLRFSQWKGPDYEARNARTPQELEAWLLPLVEAGVDIFDASTRRFWLPEFEESDLNLAGWAKKITGKTAMTVGSIGLEGPLDNRRLGGESFRNTTLQNVDRLMEMFARGDFDLVGIGRVVLTNPEWPKIVRRGEFGALRAYDPEAVRVRLECGDD